MTNAALKPRVLIVDDEPPLRELMCVTLGSEFECVEAGDGAEALRLMHEEPPALVFLDIMLPDRSGLDILQEMRDDDDLRGVPTVVVSAWQSPENMAEAMGAGADGFLPKPFQVEELESIAHDLVRRL